MVVQKTSVFPASRFSVFQKLQQLKTLQYIAWPYAAFEPVGETVSTWAVGSTSVYRFRLFGVIPFGTHTIHIVRFDPDGISSQEENEHVPVWNHDITLEAVDAKHTRYTDRVEIQAGQKTLLIWLWTKGILCPQAKEVDQIAEGRVMIVLIFGAGVIDGPLCHALCSCGNDVTVIARGARTETLQTEGLRIRHKEYKRCRYLIQDRLGVLAATRTVRKHLPLCASAIRRRLHFQQGIVTRC